MLIPWRVHSPPLKKNQQLIEEISNKKESNQKVSTHTPHTKNKKTVQILHHSTSRNVSLVNRQSFGFKTRLSWVVFPSRLFLSKVLFAPRIHECFASQALQRNTAHGIRGRGNCRTLGSEEKRSEEWRWKNFWAVVSTYFACSPRKLGIFSHFDKHIFLKGVKPPTSFVLFYSCSLCIFLL